MTAAAIIEEVKRLPPIEQAEVVRFAFQLNAERRLTGDELSTVASAYVAASESEAPLLREELIRGFYGGADASGQFRSTQTILNVPIAS